MTPETLGREIARYNPPDAAEVSRRVRAMAGREPAVDAIVELYEEVLAEQDREGTADAGGEGQAAAAYVLWAARQFEERLEQARARRRPGWRRAWDRLRGAQEP